MPRRQVVTREEVYKNRAKAWEFHYRNRKAAQQMIVAGWNSQHVLDVLARAPAPALDVDARILDAPLGDRVLKHDLLEELGWPLDLSDLLCIWYWSDAHWMAFVHEFQALPDVDGDHYYLYDEDTDCYALVPMASKAKRRQVQVQVHPKYIPVQVG